MNPPQMPDDYMEEPAAMTEPQKLEVHPCNCDTCTVPHHQEKHKRYARDHPAFVCNGRRLVADTPLVIRWIGCASHSSLPAPAPSLNGNAIFAELVNIDKEASDTKDLDIKIQVLIAGIKNGKFGGARPAPAPSQPLTIASKAFQAGIECGKEEAQHQPPATDAFCKWEYDFTHDKWDTNCGHAFILYSDDPKENGIKFCPYCGKIIATIRQQQQERAP